jgi:hypothetical protein
MAAIELQPGGFATPTTASLSREWVDPTDSVEKLDFKPRSSNAVVPRRRA